jgi:hypothetical protein
MKKIFFLPVLFLSLVCFTSCEDDSLDPLPNKVIGNYVMLNATQRSLDYSDLSNAAFKGTLSVPGNNIVKYELFIRRRNPNGINTSDFVLLETITSFPYELNITPEKIAAALDINVSDLQDGDVYRFIGYSYTADGTKTGYNDLSATLKSTETMKQGYKWSANMDSTVDPLVPFNIYTPFSL